ncbi:MAG TPA: squalene/phytoene synthase family protein [Anaerolineales bacterium]|nr:squalene/phytoene synthase family protein [Anaerolineales bacterium]HLB48517.1 squalene/phytoene synthase family protein [Anaerolineales bacterium]
MTTLRDMLRTASRTFALGIERLPGVLSDAVMVAYLLLRVSDYLEDNEQMSSEQKVALLRLWDQILAGQADVRQLTLQMNCDSDTENPDAIVAQHAEDVLTRLRSLPPEVQEPIVSNVRESTQGMARWVARGPVVGDEADMDDYMHEVAGRVGYLLTHLFAWYSYTIRLHKDTLMPLAREFGLALQTVNVIRGLREDYERGWIFVPESFCAAVHISRDQLFQPEHRTEAMKVLDMLADKAERHLRAALTYLKSLPPWQHSIRLFCIFPLMFAVRTLAISRRNHQVLESEAKITREEVARIVRDSTFWGWSNMWLDHYYRQLSVVGE